MSEGDPLPDAGRAFWPPGTVLEPGEGIVCTCLACGLEWRIHRQLAGFRLRCRCGQWIDVPAPPDRAALDDPEGKRAALVGAAPPAPPQVQRVAPVAHPVLQTWDGRPLEPDAHGNWDLRHAALDQRKSWIDRTVLELLLICAAFWVPALVIQMGSPERSAVFLPIASLVTSVLVLLVIQLQRTQALAGMKSAPLKFFFEAGAVTVGLVIAALIWVSLLRHLLGRPLTDEVAEVRGVLGLPMALFVIALCPGVFEELAFRGLFQERLALLMGPMQGALVGGAAFALAHGVTLAFPLHVTIGIYLSFLRLRSGSLLPGMMLHMGYNGALVLLTGSA